MRKKLFAALGATGTVIWFICSVALMFAPLIILHLPFFVDFLIITVVSSVPILGSIVNVVIWIWALIVNINGPQDILAYIFYVLFALNAFYVVATLFPAKRR